MTSSSFYLPVFLTQVLFLLLCYSPSAIRAFPASAGSAKPQCHEADMSALLQFKSSFIVAKGFAWHNPLAYPKTEYWVLGNVNNGTSSNCCLWDGVQCDEKTGHVTALDLSSSLLYGSINSSSSLFRLVHLQMLNLAGNHFDYSQIPISFGLLSSLTYLNLSYSAFSGQVPLEISKLSRLVSLDLSSNMDPYYSRGLLQLQSPGLSPLIDNLTLLEDLVLTNVNISSPVPESLANLSSLRTLGLANTDVHSEFPASVFQLPKLEVLSLSINNVIGHLPEFNSTSPLRILWLPQTRFSGKLPASLGNLRSLNMLSLNSNGCNVSGSIPDSIGNLRSLNYLDIAGCKFSGSIPSSFGNLSELMYLDVSMNQFTAQTLESLSWLWKLTKLTTLSLKLNLQGEIPPSIGNLSQIDTLDLIGNELDGQIPPQLMNLTKISKLFLRNNQLSGQLPDWLMNMTQLAVLDLATNKFQGPIPKTISQLQNLEVLLLFGNNLSGTLELDTLFPLKNLVILQLAMNQLSIISGNGTNSGLSQLLALGLGSCNLTEFPKFLKNNSAMNWLDLSNNKIGGEIPSWIWNLSANNLEFLNLSYNSLTGFAQRPTILPWNYLVTLDLTSNLLEGWVPTPQPWIRSYLVSNNRLTGQFPASICNWSSLVSLDLSFNFLIGELPQCLGNISESLSILNLQGNGFQGTVPQFRASGKQLRMISLAQNQLHGRLPRSLANCLELQFINFGMNQFNDTFPSWLESLPKLRVLILQRNQFHGSIGRPVSKNAFQKLRVINLPHNSFAGKLPRKYFACWKDMKVVDTAISKMSYMSRSLLTANSLSYTYTGDYKFPMTIMNKGVELSYPIKLFYQNILDVLAAVDLSGNMFEGEIPDVIGELKGLRLLNLSSNFLSRQIPTSMGNLGVLESLDLSRNRLSGEIPQELVRLNFLSVLDLSYNNLTGPIPNGKQFDTFLENAYEGNEGLCGDIISKRCGGLSGEPAGKTPDDNQGSDSSSDLDWKIVLMGYGGGLVIGVVIGSVFISDQHGWFAAIIVRVQERRRRRRRGHRR